MAFRKWKRPTVKQGGTLKTPIGLLAIEEISVVNSVSDVELAAAGYTDRLEFEKELSKSPGEHLYRIKFHLAGPDPRIDLRNADTLTPEDFEKIQSKLSKFDKSERYPGWATKVLNIIHDNPGKSAGWISDLLDIEKDWLKPSIRKLKEIGLTISLDVGYNISPRGNAYLQKQKK